MLTPRPQRIRPPAPPAAPKPRAWERVTPKHPVLVSAIDDGENVARGGALNISGGGLGCYLYGAALPKDGEVLARLNLHGHGHRVLKVFARVAWVRSYAGEDATRYGLTWQAGGDLDEVRESIPSLG